MTAPYNDPAMGSSVIVRLFALVLALALAWAGLASQQPAHVVVAPAAEQALAALQTDGPRFMGQSPAGEPTPDDPHDAQSHAEILSDLPALVPERHAALVPTLTMARPGAYTLAALHPPFLDGLRRPPRA